jgi:16S rRNA (cytosine967-C5)-methyltransferase
LSGALKKASAGAGADPVRAAAHQALLAFSQNPCGADSLHDRFQSPDFGDRDRRFLRELIYGALRWRNRLDAAYGRFLKEPEGRLAPHVREALRLGAYQILFLDRVPDHGAVNTAVELAGRKNRRGARGLVNAVLRKVSQEPFHPPGGMEDRLTVWESHPRWLVRRWIARLGEEAARARCEANNAEGPLVLRANPLKGDAAALAKALEAEGVPTEPGRYDPECLWADTSGVSFTQTASYAAGEFIVQDEASSLAAQFAGVAPGQRALDVCAAPGGKTAVLAWMAGAGGKVIAADRAPGRLGRLKNNCARISAPVGILAMDAGKLAFGPVFDHVLIDAPCSGLGVLRRHPDARWRLRERDLERHGHEQRALIAGAAGAVRPGGCLTYSVCTNEPEETDEVAGEVDRAGFLREAGTEFLPPGARKFVDSGGALRILPEAGGGLDGFFAVRWRRPLGGGVR